MPYVTPHPDWQWFAEDRAKHLRGILEDSTDEAAFAAVDLSSGTVSLRIRVVPVPLTGRELDDALVDQELSLVGDGSGGKFDDYVTVSSRRGQVAVELVLVDSAVTGQATPTTYREEQVASWLAEVVPSLQPNA